MNSSTSPFYFYPMKKALLQLHLAVLLWGFTGVFGKLIHLDAVLLVWWRMLITAISFWVLFFFQGKLQKPAWKDIVRIAGNGVILALHWVCFYASIKMTNISVALTCLATSGLFSALVEPIFFKKKINHIEIVFGSLALVGVGIIYYANLQFSSGIYIGLLAALLTVFVSIINKKFTSIYEANTITVYQMSGGFVGLSILLPIFFSQGLPKQILPETFDWLWLLILCWICTMLTFSLYIRALKKVSAFTVNLTLTLEPVYGILLAFILFREDKMMSNSFYLGLFIILLSVLLDLFMKIRKQQKKEIANLSEGT